VTGELVTAALLNTHLRDNLVSLDDATNDPPRFSLVRAGDQSIASAGGGTDLTIGTGETIVFDTDSFQASASDDFVTIPADGDYLVTAGCQFDANSTGLRQLKCDIGSNTAYGDEVSDFFVSAPGHATLPNRLSMSKLCRLETGATLTLSAYQNSGGNLDCHSVVFTVHRFAGL
jgi:hypothetical protein